MSGRTVGSLFSGIGGIELGLERAGWRTIWQVEYDSFCREILRRHWPDVPLHGNIKRIDFRNIPRPTLLAGGFPCQSVSLSGKRRGQRDPRWLWPQFARAISDLRPDYVLVENVRGLLSKGMGDILADLATLGYDAEWECLPAAAFGAPHLRWRVFIVAYPHVAAARPGAQADTALLAGDGLPGARGAVPAGGCESGGDQEAVAGPRVFGSGGNAGGDGLASDWWRVEPGVGRMAYGVPARLDRLRALGNAVVPQVTEWIGRRIAADYERRSHG